MHFDHWINRDGPGLKRFEKMLATYKNVKWVGHAQYFWREISAKIQKGVRYPTGPVVPGGRIEKLMKKYTNLYADLSASSGYTAITRDPEFGIGFLKRWSHRLLFATDTIHTRKMDFCSIHAAPMADYLREAPLSKSAFDRIARKNAEKVFRI